MIGSCISALGKGHTFWIEVLMRKIHWNFSVCWIQGDIFAKNIHVFFHKTVQTSTHDKGMPEGEEGMETALAYDLDLSPRRMCGEFWNEIRHSEPVLLLHTLTYCMFAGRRGQKNNSNTSSYILTNEIKWTRKKQKYIILILINNNNNNNMLFKGVARYFLKM